MTDLNVLFQQAVAAHQAGELAEAEAMYRALPEHPKILQNLGVLLAALGRHAEAEAALRRSLALAPGVATAENSLGRQLMAQGRYAEGWPLLEARRQDPATPMPRLALPSPEWMGEPLEGRHIVVIGEQGFGDQIMFARFLPSLRAKGARVSFVVSPPLKRLFSVLDLEVLAGDGSDRLPAGDCSAFLCSLPGRLGVTLDNLPPPVPIVGTPRGRAGGVGVAAQGRPDQANNRNRSMSTEAAARLRALGRDLSPEATGARDFQDTADIIAGLDLVISVDTAIAHLAASLGKPTWILLAQVGTDWRYERGRNDCRWYPSSRLFRQPAAGDWDSVLDAVDQALSARPGG